MIHLTVKAGPMRSLMIGSWPFLWTRINRIHVVPCQLMPTRAGCQPSMDCCKTWRHGVTDHLSQEAERENSVALVDRAGRAASTTGASQS